MIRYAAEKDAELLCQYDHHISGAELRNRIQAKMILLMFHDGVFIGWLRFNLFWDNTPFMNMLYLLDGYRGKGYGRRLVRFWEREMLESGYTDVLTSTRSDEQAQFFYRKMGYEDRGALLLPGGPLEIILAKHLE